MKHKLKGRKFYGVLMEKNGELGGLRFSLKEAKNLMEYGYKYLVELEVTKVYERNPEIIEIDV